MVQGSSSYDYLRSNLPDPAWDKTSKRTGYEAVKKLEQEKKQKEIDRKYGAWGSTFKNKDHFTNMHLC